MTASAATGSNRRLELWLYIAQRASAIIMAPLVLAHLGIILYAVRSGLSATEILARTQGSFFWAAFYSLFVTAAAVHGTIGLRGIIRETTGWRGARVDASAALFTILALALGFRAVGALT